MRVLHCPTTTGNNAWMLSQAERTLGIESDVMVFRNDWIGYPANIDLRLNPKRPWGLVRLGWFFLQALRQYDIFHFNFGSSFIPQAVDLKWLELCDLALLKRLGKGIVVTYNGSDARQTDYCLSRYEVSPYTPPYGTPDFGGRKDELKRRRISKFGRNANRIFALNPDLLKVLPPGAEFLPYSNVDIREWQLAPEQHNDRVVIVHAPTKRGLKGTEYIVDAVERLKSEYPVELRLVENVPHEKVRKLYAQADIAVDQLLVGWYGGFAVEMMALGKPVVCYIRDEDLGVVPKRMRTDMPIIRAEPNTIYDVLAATVSNAQERQMLGRRGREYVERWHDPTKIAAGMREVYESLI